MLLCGVSPAIFRLSLTFLQLAQPCFRRACQTGAEDTADRNGEVDEAEGTGVR